MASARDILGAKGPFAKALAAYETRESQLAMADAVERNLEDGGVLLVEAGTGTGKTLAYLVPALLSGKRVVISTGTKALQDQIMSYDVPMLEKLFGLKGDIVCLKGLSNYLCLRRYEEHRRSPEALGLQSSKRLPMLEEWRGRTTTGDKAELDDLSEDDPFWGLVSSGSDTRIGAKCSFYEECFVTNARRRAEEARVIVVNHHLFFADLATRHPNGGGILPEYDAVIFDEAHQIEDVATEFFGARVSTTRIETLVRDARASFGAARLSEEAHVHTAEVLDRAAQFFSQVPRTASAEASRLSLTPEQLSPAMIGEYHALDGALEGLEALARLHTGKSEALAQIARRVRETRADLATILDGGSDDHVTWSESRGRRTSIGSSPIDVRRIVRDWVVDRTPAVVFTSATLSTGGSFSFVKHRFGLDREEAEELTVPSPFDYAKQAALYLPELPDPRSPEYFAAAAEEALSLLEITGGGAFVLCTSHRAVTELRKRVEPRTKLKVLSQGSAPKAALLDEFRRDGHAVLFATSSFWEGIDVPGDALRLVIVDKLPFDVPSDPVIGARCKRIEDAGDSAFMKLLVPSAAIALKQGFGRLIRTRSDHGIVAIFDARITTKSYGRVFLKSLPDATRCRRLDEVRAFYSSST